MKILLFFAIILFSSCSKENHKEKPNSVESGEKLGVFVEKLRSIIDSVKAPNYRHRSYDEIDRAELDFDYSEIFNVLTSIKPKKGYRIDYVYNLDGMGGYPIIYAQSRNESRLKYFKDYKAKYLKQNVLNILSVEDNIIGYFQFILFDLMKDQFYLWWHALYNDVRLICDQKTLDLVLQYDLSKFYEINDLDEYLGDEEKLELETLKLNSRKLDTSVHYSRDDQWINISVLTFSNWEGFVRYKYKIRNEYPHIIYGCSKSIVLEYDCGIQW